MIQTDPINRNMEIISCITLNAGILNLISSGDLPGFNNSGFIYRLIRVMEKTNDTSIMNNGTANKTITILLLKIYLTVIPASVS